MEMVVFPDAQFLTGYGVSSRNSVLEVIGGYVCVLEERWGGANITRACDVMLCVIFGRLSYLLMLRVYV